METYKVEANVCAGLRVGLGVAGVAGKVAPCLGRLLRRVLPIAAGPFVVVDVVGCAGLGLELGLNLLGLVGFDLDARGASLLANDALLDDRVGLGSRLCWRGLCHAGGRGLRRSVCHDEGFVRMEVEVDCCGDGRRD